MITMNGSFFVALIIIIFLITIKWIEWFLFKGGARHRKPSTSKDPSCKKDSKLMAFYLSFLTNISSRAFILHLGNY